MLVEEMDKMEVERFKLDALLYQGIDVDKAAKEKEKSRPLFRDPKEYASMTKEEKDKETERIMGSLFSNPAVAGKLVKKRLKKRKE